MCHSLDYIPMNSVFLDRKGWEGSVNKMVKVMGAPISEQDAPPSSTTSPATTGNSRRR